MSAAHLSDAINCLGYGHFSVCPNGKSWECSCGPPHPKKVKHDNTNETQLTYKATEVGVYQSRGRGKISHKLGCSYKINYQPTHDNLVKMIPTNVEHDKCGATKQLYTAIIKKSHSKFHDISHGTKVQIAQHPKKLSI